LQGRAACPTSFEDDCIEAEGCEVMQSLLKESVEQDLVLPPRSKSEVCAGRSNTNNWL
jgi:hypothetical protein